MTQVTLHLRTYFSSYSIADYSHVYWMKNWAVSALHLCSFRSALSVTIVLPPIIVESLRSIEQCFLPWQNSLKYVSGVCPETLLKYWSQFVLSYYSFFTQAFDFDEIGGVIPHAETPSSYSAILVIFPYGQVNESTFWFNGMLMHWIVE